MRPMSTKHSAIAKPKKPVGQDWHRADIVASIWKLGSSVEKLGREHGYAPRALVMSLHRPWPKGERIIAEFLGTTPQTIWPSRYHAVGAPKSGRGERGIGRYKPKHSTSAGAVNVYTKRAA